jgi:hypothetical protein
VSGRPQSGKKVLEVSTPAAYLAAIGYLVRVSVKFNFTDSQLEKSTPPLVSSKKNSDVQHRLNWYFLAYDD